jgi:hypothetical protein
MSGALRFNEGKPGLAYILQFVNPMKAIARIMEFGAAKYDDGNWRKGGKPDKEYLDSMMRHLTYWLHGEVYDDDSGCSHLGHAIWNLLALHELNHPDEIMDDEVFKKQCAHWKAKKEKEDRVPSILQHGPFISKEKAEKYMESLKEMNEGQIRTSAASGIGQKLRNELRYMVPFSAKTVKVGGDSKGKSECEHAVFCTCDNCMELSSGQVEFKNTWGVPAKESE